VSDTDEVALQVPARPQFGRVIRVGGAALALRQGLSFNEIDELRLAVDEAVILLLDGVPAGASIAATFRFEPEQLELEMTTSVPGTFDPQAVARFNDLTAGLLSDATVDSQAGRVIIEKRSGASAAA